MKTIFLSVLLSLSIISSFYAQEKNTSKSDNLKTEKSNVGVKVGYNLSAVSFDGDAETDQRNGFHAGFYGESFFTESVALQIELLYSQQGYQLHDDGGTYTQKLDYINMPLVFKMYPSENFFLEVGPQVGLVVSHKEEYDSNFNLFDTSREFNPQKFDWGLDLGAGFKTNSGVSIGARYHLGFGDIYDENSPKNRVWQFYLGFDL
ncbi:porin family protein [Tenacibaculum sp. UWU-22]|uniref:porin family protein n=1 Tax=Tenacibaculum sp. UWU-22 TaxID=3234187 RepID=UPI0034DAE598